MLAKKISFVLVGRSSYSLPVAKAETGRQNDNGRRIDRPARRVRFLAPGRPVQSRARKRACRSAEVHSTHRSRPSIDSATLQANCHDSSVWPPARHRVYIQPFQWETTGNGSYARSETTASGPQIRSSS